MYAKLKANALKLKRETLEKREKEGPWWRVVYEEPCHQWICEQFASYGPFRLN